jgi:hypothetical protein
MTIKIGDIVKFESMHLFGLVVDLRGRLIIVRWFDDEDGESQSIGSYSERDLIKVS